MTAFDVVDYDDSMRDAYLRLLAPAFDRGGPSGAELDWWLAGDPERTICSVGLAEGEVVGVSMHSVFRAVLDGREQAVQFSLNNVTATHARGKGLWQTLERRNEEEGLRRGTALALSFPNDTSRPIYLGPLGWRLVDRRRLWARPLRAPVRRGSQAPDRSDDSAVNWHDGVVRIAHFGREHEAVYGSVRSRLGNHVVRDGRYLNWRYLEGPRSYTALASGDGLAVVGTTVRGRLHLALVMDLLSPSEHAGPLLRACVAAAGGADALLALPTPCLPKTVLARNGFAPTHERLELIEYGLAAPPESVSAGWTYTFGDTDFF